MRLRCRYAGQQAAKKTISRMDAPPIAQPDTDSEQLKLLSIFHYVVAGLAALFAWQVPGFATPLHVLFRNGLRGVYVHALRHGAGRVHHPRFGQANC